ncbi:MAG: hypothetical protein ABJE47_22165 [bacterium]
MQTPPVSTTDVLSALLAFVSALSIASERAVAVMKTFIPWMRDENPGSDTLKPGQEEGRRFAVFAVSYVCSLGICLVVSNGSTVVLVPATDAMAAHTISAFAVAFLAMGGSAFWAQVIGVLSAIKDVQKPKAPAVKPASLNPVP